MAAMAATAAASAAAKVASTVATKLIYAGRTWAKGYMDKSIQKLVAQNNMDSDDQKSATLDEDAVCRRNVILKALTKDLEDIKESIGVLRNKDYNGAKRFFIEALRWTKDEDHFKKYIDDSLKHCLLALDTVPTATDQIQVYSLCIATGFIKHSDYGRNPVDGLRHIYYTLQSMNSDAKLRKELSTAFGSKVYWNGGQKELLRSVVLFSVQMFAFIVEIQESVLMINAVPNSNDYQKAVDMVKHVMKEEMKEKGDDIDAETLLKRDWVPRYPNGYYFGNIGGNGCKYSTLDEKQLVKLINLPKGHILFPKNGKYEFCAPNSEFQILCGITEVIEKGDDQKNDVGNNAMHQIQCGNRKLLTVTPNFRIEDLKENFLKLSGKSLVRFWIFFEGEGLSDNKVISDYPIFPGDHLDFILEQRMEMEYHRGRGYMCSPNRLLDGNKDTWYWSGRGLPSNEDWMIFKRTQNAAFNIKHVMIRNWGYNDAIKSIVISTSSEDVDDQYIKLMEIKDIKQEDEERQWFAVKQESGKEAKHKINFIRIDILQNYGSKLWNEFEEFGLFGVSE